MQETFTYLVSPSRHAAGLALCAALAITVAYFAATNTVGLNGFKSLSFSADEASLIFWGVAAIFGGGAIACSMMLRRSLQGAVHLSLGQTNLGVPRASLRGDMLSVPYTAIKQVTLHSVQKQQLLVIDTSLGQSRVSSIGFASELEFERFYKGLTAKIGRGTSQ